MQLPDFLRRLSSQEADIEREVLSTIHSLLETVTSPEKAAVVLDRCARNSMSGRTYTSSDMQARLSTLLQKKSMPGDHTPLFHAIIQTKDKDSSKILNLILTACRPLTSSTLADIRNACIIRDNNQMFQLLRCSAEYEDSSLTGTERLFFSKTEKRDSIEVKAGTSNSKPTFTADFAIPMFQERMRSEGKLELYFVVQGARVRKLKNRTLY